MTNTLRRFSQPIMIILTVLVIVAFSLWTPSWSNHSGTNAPVTTIRGKPVSMETYQRESRRMQLYAQLGGEYFRSLEPAAGMQKISRIGVENSLLFEDEANALGITATQKDLEDQLANRTPAFRGEDGNFDPARFEEFVKRALNPEGFSKGQIEEFLVGEVRIRKVRDLLATTFPATPIEVKEQFLRQRLMTEASYVVIPVADLRKDLKVTDEELKQRFEAKKDFLKTMEKRRVRYAAFTLPPPADGKQADVAVRTEQLQQLANSAYDLAAEVLKPGANFDELAKAKGATLGETVEFFGEDAGPPELEASPEVAEAAFSLTKERPYSPHLSLQNGTYVLALKDTKPPEPLTFDQARNQLEDELLQEKADTALRKKAEESRGKLAEALKAGKSFSEAAQSLGLKAEPFPAFSGMQPPPPGTKYNGLVQEAARKLAPGEISDVVPTPEAVLIVHVDQRPVVDEKGIEDAKKEISSRIDQMHKFVTFAAWLAERRQAAGLKDSPEL
jgi:parvulin-like peptidyl-prolyl isomerase